MSTKYIIKFVSLLQDILVYTMGVGSNFYCVTINSSVWAGLGMFLWCVGGRMPRCNFHLLVCALFWVCLGCCVLVVVGWFRALVWLCFSFFGFSVFSIRFSLFCIVMLLFKHFLYCIVLLPSLIYIFVIQKEGRKLYFQRPNIYLISM